MTLELYLTITWCFLKPLLFIVMPTVLIAQRFLFRKGRS